MGRFPCEKCQEIFPAPLHLKFHKQSGTCPGRVVPVVPIVTKPLYKFNFFVDGRPASIDAGKWQAAGVEGAHHCLGGLGGLGVVLVNLKDDQGVVVYKPGGPSTLSDYFCSLLYRDFGMSCPRMRLMPKAECHTMVQTLLKADFSEEGGADFLQNERLKDAGGVLMEFVRGVTLCDPAAAGLLQSSSTAATDSSSSSSAAETTTTSQSLLTALGSLVALDMLVNNVDRTPFIWGHTGNGHNVMFENRSGGSGSGGGMHVVAIDNSSQPIMHPEGRAAYLAKVVSGIREAKAMDVNGPLISKMRSFIRESCGHDVGEDGCRVLQAGVVAAAHKIASTPVVERMWQKASGDMLAVGASNSSAFSDHLDFLREVAQTMGEALRSDQAEAGAEE
eukprot:m.103732 g.103732  ORF g.103732 m.103732 type:complete len:390 (-) comp15728_c0_seq2:184-1353(-)